jgi:hypothetical protein
MRGRGEDTYSGGSDEAVLYGMVRASRGEKRSGDERARGMGEKRKGR